MRVALGKFARSGIESRFGADVAAGVQAALLHYTRRLMSGWPPVVIPRFCSDGAPASREDACAFELPVDPEIQAALEQEARRHRVPVGQVLAHAVFVYLADVDSACQDESDAWRPAALDAR